MKVLSFRWPEVGANLFQGAERHRLAQQSGLTGLVSGVLSERQLA